MLGSPFKVEKFVEKKAPVQAAGSEGARHAVAVENDYILGKQLEHAIRITEAALAMMEDNFRPSYVVGKATSSENVRAGVSSMRAVLDRINAAQAMRAKYHAAKAAK